MALLPEDTRLKTEILIEDEIYRGDEREYLGISTIGHDCLRKLWYDFRHCGKSEYSARIHRLFQRGHREEPIIVEDLKRIGVVFHSDQEEVSFAHGHIKGHLDGIGENIPDAPKTPHLLEFKTMAEKYFKILKNNGLKKANPVYYCQVQCYMRLKKLTRCLFIAVNKNTDERYYERIKLEKKEADDFLERGYFVVNSNFPPPRFESYKCNWCDYKSICKEGGLPRKHCRTCCHSSPDESGAWYCSKYEKLLNFKQQLLIGCGNHQFLNGF